MLCGGPEPSPLLDQVGREQHPSLTEFGVTAFDERDALAILSHVIFAGKRLPDIPEMRSDVDVRDLDQACRAVGASGTRRGTTPPSTDEAFRHD
jgi:hypothetical protein